MAMITRMIQAGQEYFISISGVNGMGITAVTAGVLCQAATDRRSLIDVHAWLSAVVYVDLAGRAAHHVLTTAVAALECIGLSIISS